MALKGKTNERIKWIDCAKAIAIMAVVIDHCNGRLYTNFKIAQVSYYSTSLFVLLSGISASLSFDRDVSVNKNKILRRLKNLFIQYAVATLIVTCFSNKFFDLKVYLSNLINFSAVSAYYYFVFLFQLIVISPFLIRWCKFCRKQKPEIFWHMGTLLILGIISAISINYTFIFDVYGGGRFLWGGYLLFAILCGNFVRRERVFKRKKQKSQTNIGSNISHRMAFVVDWNVSGSFTIRQMVEPVVGAGFNPPGVNFMVFALITLFFCYAFFSLLDEIREIAPVKWFMNGLTWIGGNTLHIFLYHLLAGSIEFYVFTKLGVGLDGMVSRICYFTGMLVLPVVAKELFNEIRKKLVLMI